MSDADHLFIEPFGGLAGDMFLAALLDLGDPRFTLDDLRALAGSIVPEGARLDVEDVKRRSLRGLRLDVRTPESEHGPHRGLSACLELIAAAGLPAAAAERAGRTMRCIAEAEARVHGIDVERVHFHEVGAVDALVDVCGAALALERLGSPRVHASPPITGSGTVHCAHGEMPVPAPGTAEILRGIPHVLGGGAGERLTPTGAALLATLVDSFEAPPALEVAAVGYGAGSRDPEQGPPNLVRVQLGRSLGGRSNATGVRTAWLLEFNVDDMSGEELGHLVGRLREGGALEVWTSALQMKKDRPGTLVSLLCRGEQRDGLEALTFAHSTTLGLRWTRTTRRECERRTLEVELFGHTLRVVRRLRPGARGDEAPIETDLSPEFDDLARVAGELGLPLRDLERAAVEAALVALAAGREGPVA